MNSQQNVDDWDTNAILVELVRPLIEQVDDPRKRDALALLSLIGSLNEHELRLGLRLSALDGRAIFDWLRTLAIVRTVDAGLVLHRGVGAAIVAELHFRDPPQARDLVTKILGVIEKSLGWRGGPRSRSLGQLRALAANAPQDPALVKMFELGELSVAAPQGTEIMNALELIETLEGPESAAIAARFIAYDPAAVTIVRGPDHVSAVMIRVEFRGCTIPPPLVEPALERLLEVLDRSGELRPRVLVRVTRFFIARESYQAPCRELAILGALMTQQTIETQEPFINVQYLDARAIDGWRNVIDGIGCFERRDDAAVELGSRYLVPFIVHISDLEEALLSVVHRAWGLSFARVSEGKTAELETEVARALGHLRDPLGLGACALGRHLFADLEVADRGDRLREWLRTAITETENMRRGDLIARALRASFDGSRALHEAADAARMSVSTLKRYKKLGIQRIAELARQIPHGTGQSRSSQDPR